MNPVFTVGHSTHPSAFLLDLLRRHGVTAVADVRSQPYSRMNAQFNRETLRAALKRVGIAYVFMGNELGARSDDPDCYHEGKVQYDRLGRTQSFSKGIARLTDGSTTHRIALLCAEKDPLTCHRTILIARHVAAAGLAVRHILANGELEPHDKANSRLLREVGLPQGELFRSREQLLDEAYRRREREIAFVDPNFAPARAALEHAR